MKKSLIKTILSLLLVLCVATGISDSVFGANTDTVSVADYFLIPDVIDKTAYVGEKTEIARILPSDDEAENYLFTVLDSDNRETDTDGYSFLPLKEGVYKCLFSYTLDKKTYTYSYTVSVTVKDGPIFENIPQFPNAFVSGKKYELPEVKATDYSDGSAVHANVSVFVECGGTVVPVIDNSFVPELKRPTDKVVITYRASNGNKSDELKATVPLVRITDESGNLNMTELFVRDGFTGAGAYEDRIVFTTDGEAEAKLANAMGADGFTIEFGFGENDRAESIEITLQSLYDPSVAVVVEYKKGKLTNGVGSVLLNGKSEKPYNYAKGDKLRLSVNEKNRSIFGANNDLLFNVKETASGDAFHGFTGGLIKVSLAVKGSYGKCDLDLFKINSQMLSSATSEQVFPSLLVEEFKTEYKKGQTVHIPAARAIDVVNPNAQVSLSVFLGAKIVKDIDGKVVRDVLGEVTFIAQETGIYRLEYVTSDTSALDEFGMPVSMKFKRMIEVYDAEAPIVSVNGNVAKNVKVGEKIIVPSVSVTDNDGGENSTLQVVMFRPTGYADRIGDNLLNGQPYGTTVDETEYIFTVQGRYYLRIMATDEYGNYDKKEYIVDCGQ